MSRFNQRNFVPERIQVEASVRQSGWTRRILTRFPDRPVETIDDAEQVWLQAQTDDRPEHWRGMVLLARQRGPFLRLCPGTPRHICCLYHNLDVAAGCNLDCSYCILQGYLNTPLITLYTNLDDMFDELDRTLSRHGKQFYRIGTGELSDSLTFDDFTELSADLVRFFAHRNNAIIELKSKNTHIDHFIDLEHNRRTVVSWSLNAEPIARCEESLAPSIEDRLRAAREVQQAGFWLGFHFDPMIEHEGWKETYRETVDTLFRMVDPAQIAWISLGALRYPPGLDDIIRRRHPDSRIVLGEFVSGVDKKYRYFKPIRIEMFEHMVRWIRQVSGDVFVYLCMESDEVWRRSFGWSPGSSARLKRMLDDRVRSC